MRNAWLRKPWWWVGTLLLAGWARAEVESPVVVAEPAELARRLLDSEALYTVTGGLKPVSSHFWHTRVAVGECVQETLVDVDHALQELPLSAEFESGLVVFSRPRGEWRHVSAFVAHRPSLQRLIQRRPDAFEPLGVSVDDSAQEILERIDRGAPADRWRGFGLVFGYPDYAVEFFVAAGEEAERTGEFVEREFINLPTYTSDRGRFVYAVPRGHRFRWEDWQLEQQVRQIFAHYRVWRAAYLAGGEIESLALLAAWTAHFGSLDAQPIGQLVTRRTRLRCRITRRRTPALRALGRVVIRRSGNRRTTN